MGWSTGKIFLCNCTARDAYKYQRKIRVIPLISTGISHIVFSLFLSEMGEMGYSPHSTFVFYLLEKTT